MTTVIPYERALPEIPDRTPYTKPGRYPEKLGEGRSDSFTLVCLTGAEGKRVTPIAFAGRSDLQFVT